MMHAALNKRPSGVVAGLALGFALVFFLVSHSSLACAASAEIGTSATHLAANTSLTFYSIFSECALPASSFDSQFNMTRIDPQTGLEMSTVYANENTCQLFQSAAPVGDPRSKRAFVCAYYRSDPINELWGEPMLIIYDLSNPNKAFPKQRIPLPIGQSEFNVYLYSNLIYDAATESVWVVCTSYNLGIRKTNIFMVKVDLVKGVAKNITGLPIPHPAAGQLNEANGVFNTKTRSMWFPVVTGPEGMENMLLEFNVDEAKFVNFFQTNYTVNSLIWDNRTDTIFGFLNFGGSSTSLFYGALQPGTPGRWTILQEYANFEQAATTVLDPSTGLIYGEVYGTDNQLHFITFDVKTGTALSVKTLPQTSNADVLFAL